MSKRPGSYLPYGRQSIDAEDVNAVDEVLKSDWLTTGPKVVEFERALADYLNVSEVVVLSNGTAALHAAVVAAGVSQGDEVIVTPLTFVASANAIIFAGATPVFADIDDDTLLISPSKIEDCITSRTKAVLAVDYAGQPCDYDAISKIASTRGLKVIDDACHALGATYRGKMLGGIADLTTFSFHPVKHITTGEGGAVATNNLDYARQIRVFRNHGIATDLREREASGNYSYEMIELGYNYRLSDIHCALGLSQLRKLPKFLDKRRALAAHYQSLLKNVSGIRTITTQDFVEHAFHLFVVRISENELGINRDKIFKKMRDKNIGVNVHYSPVHLHPFYRRKFRTLPGLFPISEKASKELLTLPLFPEMTYEDVERVVSVLSEAIKL